MHGNIHQVLLGTRKGGKMKKQKETPVLILTSPTPTPNTLLRPLNSTTHSEAHKAG